MKTKFLYIEVVETNGEREYTHRVLREVSSQIKDITSWADKNIAAGIYGDKPKNVDGKWEYNDGEVICELYKVMEITQLQYEVLTKFIQ